MTRPWLGAVLSLVVLFALAMIVRQCVLDFTECADGRPGRRECRVGQNLRPAADGTATMYQFEECRVICNERNDR